MLPCLSVNISCFFLDTTKKYHASKMLESQDEQNEIDLHKACKSKIPFGESYDTLKMQLFLFIPTWFGFISPQGMAHVE